jgi:hypothetical protein
MKDNLMEKQKPPINSESALAASSHALIANGRTSDARLIASAHGSLDIVGYDNWDGGTDVWERQILVAFSDFLDLGDDKRKELQSFIDDVISPFLPERGVWIHSVIKPREIRDPDWRKRLLIGGSEDVLTNQGRGHSSNPAALQHDGLFFRSPPEIEVYKALKATGIPFAPLPVFVRGGVKFSRVEPDFVLMKDGVVVFVEVDGSSYHKETPADAHYRLKPFQDEGVRVERVKAEDCNTPEKASRFAKQLVNLIEKWRNQK